MLFRYPFNSMGCSCEIQIRDKHPEPAKAAVKAALGEIHRLEEKYSFYRPDSLISLINDNAYQCPLEIDSETQGLLEFVSETHRLSNGKFDPTIGSLKEIWNFPQMEVPNESKIIATLESIDWNSVSVENNSIRFMHPQTKIDFGGVVKEYAVDQLCRLLETMKIETGIVNLGGDVGVVGKVPNNQKPWRIGIAHPRRHGHSIGNIILREGAVVTSGDYQRYFLRDGKRYHHLFDPQTGYPADLCYSSVTIIDNSALKASQTATSKIFSNREFGDLETKEYSYVACDLNGKIDCYNNSDLCQLVIFP